MSLGRHKPGICQPGYIALGCGTCDSGSSLISLNGLLPCDGVLGSDSPLPDHSTLTAGLLLLLEEETCDM